MLRHPLRFLGLGRGIGVRLLLRQLTRMDHDKTQRLLNHPPVTILHGHLPGDTLPVPSSRRLLPGASRFLHQERQRGLLLPPGLQFLPYRTGAWHQRDEPDSLLETQTHGSFAVPLAVCHNAHDPVETQRETCLDRHGSLRTITGVAIANAHPQGQPAIAAHAQAQEHLLEIIAAVFTMPIGGTGRLWGLRLVLIRAIEGNGCRILVQPRGGDGIDFQCFQRDSAKHTVEIGRKQRIEDLPQPVIMQRGTPSSLLEQGQHPTLLETCADLIERMVSVQNRQDQRFHPTPTREDMGRVGGDQAVDNGGHLSTP